MLRKSQLSMAVGAALGLTSLAFTPAYAQQQDAAQLEEVIVTGSRIARNPESYLGGMSLVGQQQIEQVGTYNTLDALIRLPSVGSQGTGRNTANGGRGANFVEIHNLEAERTLVLMNGRRVVSTIRDSSGLAVDLQSFPQIMIDRVEVLADGASAVYGSDAIAGVVNVITRDDFEGFEFTGGYGEPSEDGGEAYNYGMLFGVQGARGHMVAGATYSETKNVDYQDRDWSKIPIVGQFVDGGDTLTLIGSGIPPQGRQGDAGIIFEPNPATGESFSPYDTFGFSGLYGCPSDGSIDAIICTGHRFNYNDPGAAGVSLINGGEVYNFGIVGEVELSSNWSAYTNMLAQHREGTLNFTPLPVSGAAGRFTNLIEVPFDNPNVPADALAVIQEAVLETNPDATFFQMDWRGLDLGNRKFDYDNDTLQATFGFKGDFRFLDRDWSADTWGTWGQSRLSETTERQQNVGNLAIAVDPAQCALTENCPKNADGSPAFNPFGRNVASQEIIDFLTFTDQEKTEYETYDVGLTIATSELFALPAGNVGFAMGLEWQQNSGSVTPSGTVEDGNSGGNFAEPTSGQYDLWESYLEVDVPLLADAPFAKELGVEGAVRYSKYSEYDETTWKLGARWAPVDAVAFRAQASTGFRAPNILELFGGVSDTFTGVTDPCVANNQAANPVVKANCASQGVPPDFVQTAAQLKTSAGGNPDLGPESSDNYTFGIVLTPDIWGQPRLAFDYYSVEVKDAIGTPNAADVINACYESPGLSAAECERLDRGSVSLQISRFDLLTENLNEIKTSGVDFNSTFSWDTSFGVVTADWLVTYIDEWKQTSDTGVEDDRTGIVVCDVCDFVAYPEWKGDMRVALSRDSWSVSLGWRYLDEMDIQDQVGVGVLDDKADAVNYFDLYGTYNWDDFQISAGVENFTDEDPPFIPGISSNTNNVYDFLGTFYSVRLKYTL
jgi:iron complex outermembrane receptor protein